jgi:alanine transaminase
VLLADEVYQRNVYDESKTFVSAKKAALDGNVDALELVSFHSTSKGFIGECGRRGGYMELHNIDPDVHAQLYKLASAGLCSGVAGQVMTSLMVRPPVEGDASYDAHAAEEAAILEKLKLNARTMVDGLNAIEGVACNDAEGAMYAFPRIEMPEKAVAAAAAASTSVDNLYALSLLEQTGICVVPASGFGQADGRAGFRTTFLPPADQVERAVALFAEHHADFCAKYA